VSSLQSDVAPGFFSLRVRRLLRPGDFPPLPLNDVTEYETIQITLRYAQFAGKMQSEPSAGLD
jgi:hypothetical protein